jgi:hypothetical protein
MSRHYFKVKDKINIVKEAYSCPFNIRPTARKYNIQPKQIRNWKKGVNNYIELRGKVSYRKAKHYTLHKGRTPLDVKHFPSLKHYYTELRKKHRIVTVEMICNELNALSESDVSIDVLRRRVYRWVANERIGQRRLTHVAQNTHHDPNVILDFVKYVNSQIACSSYSPCSIVNMDETSVSFENAGGTTLADKGSRTVSVATSGSSSRCSVVLAAALDGTTLPPLIIFKALPGGRVEQEWKQKTLFPKSVFYTVQENEVLLKWINLVWKPFCARKRRTYLLWMSARYIECRYVSIS